MLTKKKIKKLLGVPLVIFGVWMATPPYLISPTESEFWLMVLLMPLIGFWWSIAVIVAIGIASLVVGFYLLGLPLDGQGMKKAIKIGNDSIKKAKRALKAKRII